MNIAIREKMHPTLGVMVRDNGEVLVPGSYHLKEHWTKGGFHGRYHQVKINKKCYLVHRLVAETFLDNPENKPFVDHIDRDRHNNNVSNLRWVTSSENNRNTKAYDDCGAKWGVHPCDDIKAYRLLWNKEYYQKTKETKACLMQNP